MKGKPMAPTTTTNRPKGNAAPKPDASSSDAVSKPILDRLTTLADEADALVKITQPVSAFTSKVSALVKFTKDQNANDALVLSGALSTVGQLTGTIEAMRALDALTEYLAPVGSPDRTEGNALVTAFTNLKAANNPTNPMLSPEAIKTGDALVTRWAASAPKSSGSGTGQRGSGPGKPSLPGFTISATCGACHKAAGSTGKDYLNSMRDSVVNHIKDHHPNMAPIGRNTQAHDEISVALSRLGMTPDGPAARSVPEAERGQFTEADGGGFHFTRKAA